jgi:hypothetical protein
LISATIIPSKKVAEAPSSNAWASSNPFAALPGSGAELPRVNGKSNGAATTKSSTSPANSAGASTAKSNVPGADTQTKKQRQNAAKVQAKKAEKEAMEAERLTKLAQHKKQVEAERMKEFYKKQQPKSSNIYSSSPGPKTSSMPKATINEKGSLVWD